MNKSDIVIVGGGPGGYTAALHAAQKGASVVLVEEKFLGGTCLQAGCIPTKALLASAKQYNEIKNTAKHLGIIADNVQLDFEKVFQRKDRVVKRLTIGLDALFKQKNITVYKGAAKLLETGELQVDGKTLGYKKLILATGSRPKELTTLPFSPTIFSSADILSLKKQPESLLILGGGVIGIEMATFFSLIGTKVKVIEMQKNILTGVDTEASHLIKAQLERYGVEFYLDTQIESMSEGRAVVSQQQTVTYDLVLNAVGRVAQTKGLEESGIIFNTNGTIAVNSYLETSIPNVYAVGDVTGVSWLAHVAGYQGNIAVENALGNKVSTDYKAIPSCVFSYPEIASVGVLNSEKSIIKKVPLNILGKMSADGRVEGFIKVAFSPESKQIEGVVIVGPHASDLLNEGIIAVALGLKEDALRCLIRPHPTLGEIYSEVYTGTHQ